MPVGQASDASRPSAPEATLYQRLLVALPFQLTAAQQRVVAEITQDIARPIPMHRLLQGDVGAGKTVVAALAAAVSIDAGWQCALMAPTEILATQHFAKLIGWLAPLGITVAWLTGGQKAKERREMLALIASGQAQLVVGTHALIQDKVQFHRLALAIIDEQHRFGVAQRLALRGKLTAGADEWDLGQGHQGACIAGPQRFVPSDGEVATQSESATGVEPHLLMMTATPIPRTLAMSYYADLDVSTIDELPPGRTPVVTKVVSDARRGEVLARIRDQITQGRQIYWVCPLIEESEALDLTNATQTHAQLSAALPGVMVGLLHSRMPVAEKKAVMSLFVGGQMGVLVSTTVIEVGVDVPNASLMVIEHAERFGLSQLHQLRGRVGRGAAASACVLLYSTGDAPRLGETARERLKAMAQTSDGFEIARRDLEIRGPGEFMGARQSGDAMLRFADVIEDAALLDWARRMAPVMLDQYPALAEQHVQRWLGSKAEFLKA
jgi:ATP-dependent DNA helicase RecG